MDLREILQRRLKKKPSNESRPDPPAAHSDSNDVKNKDMVEISTQAGSIPRVQEQQPRRSKQPIELGTIQYCNITSDGRHGDYNTVLQVASQNMDKPIFANFVEWSG